MARNVLICLVACAALVGCSGATPVIQVVRGNVAYARGDFQGALVHYLAAPARDGQQGWLLFNIGNVYYAMGEQEAALAAWTDSRAEISRGENERLDSGQRALVHAASYNRGVLLYQQGRFLEARDEFRFALEVDSRSVSAKRNLELTLQRIASAEQAEGPTPTRGEGSPDGEEDEQTLRILDYVRRKEAQRWFANRENQQPENVRDW